jgi:hypothetical protein
MVFLVRQEILGRDFRKAILQKYPNISTGIECFVGDDSVNDCILRFLIETRADMRFGATEWQ